jgi:hypothetical protein
MISKIIQMINVTDQRNKSGLSKGSLLYIQVQTLGRYTSRRMTVEKYDYCCDHLFLFSYCYFIFTASQLPIHEALA